MDLAWALRQDVINMIKKVSSIIFYQNNSARVLEDSQFRPRKRAEDWKRPPSLPAVSSGLNYLVDSMTFMTSLLICDTQ